MALRINSNIIIIITIIQTLLPMLLLLLIMLVHVLNAVRQFNRVEVGCWGDGLA